MVTDNLRRPVLPGLPKIEVKLTRDSVCACDDCDAPHEVYSFVAPQAFVEQFWTGYLPSVNGIGHSLDSFIEWKSHRVDHDFKDRDNGNDYRL